MPTRHRIACLRDDLVFFIFLYQRWCYPVDKTRANEFGRAYAKPGEEPDDADGECTGKDEGEAEGDGEGQQPDEGASAEAEDGDALRLADGANCETE